MVHHLILRATTKALNFKRGLTPGAPIACVNMSSRVTVINKIAAFNLAGL